MPENLVAEIINGTLVTMPRPASRHALASSILGSELTGPFHRGKGGPGGWILLDEPELHLHGDVLVPDLAGWRRERMPVLPDATAFELAPDWTCELLSPSTAATDRAEKMPIYAREQVGHVWLVAGWRVAAGCSWAPGVTMPGCGLLRSRHSSSSWARSGQGEAEPRVASSGASQMTFAVRVLILVTPASRKRWFTDTPA